MATPLPMPEFDCPLTGTTSRGTGKHSGRRTLITGGDSGVGPGVKTLLYATLWIACAAIPHLGPGAPIISTSSIQASSTSPGRAGQPTELAAAHVFLASPAASYVSGAVLPVTGGRSF